MTYDAVSAAAPRGAGPGRMLRAVAGLLLAAGMMLPGLPAAEAATVQWAASGIWEASSGGERVAGEGSDHLSWGGLSKNRRSDYIFSGRDPRAEVPVGATRDFILGTFTHRNYRIPDDTGITGARLRVNLALNIGGVAVDVEPLFFDFDHWETDNRASPCANGASNRTGINSNGCADRVTILSNQAIRRSVTVGGLTYLYSVSGFFDGETPLGEFWTRENADNDAYLHGEITAVPLPAAGLLLLGGIGLLAARRRR